MNLGPPVSCLRNKSCQFGGSKLVKMLLDLFLLSIKEKCSTEFLFLLKNMSTTPAVLFQKTNWFLVVEIFGWLWLQQHSNWKKKLDWSFFFLSISFHYRFAMNWLSPRYACTATALFSPRDVQIQISCPFCFFCMFFLSERLNVVWRLKLECLSNFQAPSSMEKLISNDGRKSQKLHTPLDITHTRS